MITLTLNWQIFISVQCTVFFFTPGPFYSKKISKLLGQYHGVTKHRKRMTTYAVRRTHTLYTHPHAGYTICISAFPGPMALLTVSV